MSETVVEQPKLAAREDGTVAVEEITTGEVKEFANLEEANAAVKPAAPVVETPAPPVEEFIYEYQPVDDLNRPLGNKQVIKAKDAKDALDKIAKNHMESIKLTRELKRKNRMGILDNDELPENIQKNTEVDYSKLTVEERLEKVEAENMILRAKAEAEMFRQTTPNYYPCQENFETITNWMVKNDLAPIRENFEYAYNKLSEVGLLLSAPIVREEPTPVVVETPKPEIQANTQPDPAAASRITSDEQAQSKRVVRPASGLTRETSSNEGTPVQSTNLTIDQVERMSSEEYKRNLRNPAFVKAVNELYAKK